VDGDAIRIIFNLLLNFREHFDAFRIETLLKVIKLTFSI